MNTIKRITFKKLRGIACRGPQVSRVEGLRDERHVLGRGIVRLHLKTITRIQCIPIENSNFCCFYRNVVEVFVEVGEIGEGIVGEVVAGGALRMAGLLVVRRKNDYWLLREKRIKKGNNTSKYIILMMKQYLGLQFRGGVTSEHVDHPVGVARELVDNKDGIKAVCEDQRS